MTYVMESIEFDLEEVERSLVVTGDCGVLRGRFGSYH